MLMDRAEIAALIPHSGAMCLLDGVVSWDAMAIRCVASSHRDLDNPLRAHDRLGAVCGVEYAAQAMATHGGLTAGGSRPAAGYLASLRDLVCHVARLDDIAENLTIDAEKLMGEGDRVIYGFAIRAGAVDLLTGRAAVVIDAGGSP
jgi:predicted hotdog family 3-hydroxylacyl-ACP dehydratase